MKYRYYPTDVNGVCLRGFCPTLAKSLSAAYKGAAELEQNLRKYGFKYHHINVEAV